MDKIKTKKCQNINQVFQNQSLGKNLLQQQAGKIQKKGVPASVCFPL